MSGFHPIIVKQIHFKDKVKIVKNTDNFENDGILSC